MARLALFLIGFTAVLVGAGTLPVVVPANYGTNSPCQLALNIANSDPDR